MLNFFKSLFGAEEKNLTPNELRKLIIDQCSEEDWFINYFPSAEKLYKEKEFYTLGDSLSEISSNIKTAIVKDFLIKNNYFSKLKLKKKQLIYTDAYGDEINDDWINEVKKFTQRRTFEILSYIEANTPNFLFNELKNNNELDEYLSQNFYEEQLWGSVYLAIYDDLFEDLDLDNLDKGTDNNNLCTPYEYEKIISNKFSMLGWSTFETPGSGDQGADIVIEKYNCKFVVQCKYYSQPVGNKAVQEVTSARDFYDADGAVVVTNNTYTKSARQLAASQSVWLIHDSELENWDLCIQNEMGIDVDSRQSELNSKYKNIIHDMLSILGWNIQKVPHNTHNIDFIIEKYGLLYVVQCHLEQPHDNVISEILTAKHFYNAFDALIITSKENINLNFIELAQKNSVLVLPDTSQNLEEWDNLIENAFNP